jgi:catechol 2,3-dioxygenase-like lactoylglutathione lyase family enzyme
VRIARFDHIVLAVADIGRTCAFYERALGVEVVTFGEGRTALAFGNQKINLHQRGREADLRARRPTPGSGDFCLIADTPLADVIAHLEAADIAVEAGPVPRQGAAGPITSIYIRDPDDNLVEIATY